MNRISKLLLCTLAFAGAASFLRAQSQDARRLAFDVASIKPNNSGNPMVRMMNQPGGRFTATGVTLGILMTLAYRVQDFQIQGAPGWANSDRFDVEARTPEGVVGNQTPAMLQSMMEDRFHLKLHRETRDLPVYELVVAKEGSKLQQSKDDDGKPLSALAPPTGPLPPPAPGGPQPRGSAMIGRGMFSASAVAIDQLVRILAQQLGRPVIDKTGIIGLYDFKLQWTPEVGQGGGPFGPLPAGPGGPEGAPPQPDPSSPSIFTAVQEQLGLRLESTKGPVEVIIIDSVEKPTGN